MPCKIHLYRSALCSCFSIPFERRIGLTTLVITSIIKPNIAATNTVIIGFIMKMVIINASETIVSVNIPINVVSKA